MTANRPQQPPRRTAAQRGLTIVGSLAVLAALVLIALIISSVSGSVNQNATQIAQIPTLARIEGIVRTEAATSIAPPITNTATAASRIAAVSSATASPSATARIVNVVTATDTLTPTDTDTPTPVPVITGTPAPLPPLPFDPPAGKAFYMARLGLPGPVPIVELPIVNQTWAVDKLGHNIGHLDETNWVDPKQGNVVLVAHIQLAVTDFGPFLYLNKTQIGDLVYVTDNKQVYTYQVTKMETVNPTDLTVTYMTAQPTLTMITCTTWDQTHGIYSQRLVVTAKLVNAPAAAT